MGVLPAGRNARRISLLLLTVFLCGAAALAATYLRALYHYRAAQTDLARYHFVEARDHLAIAGRAWPSSWRIHLLAARAARLSGDTGAAEQHLHWCQQSQPDNSEMLLEWALLHASAGDLAPVEEYLRTQVSHGSEQTPLIVAALVEGYVRMYRISEAQACLENWLQRWPEDTQALFLQGCLWQQIQRPQMALRSYRRALELDPRRDDVRWRSAQCLSKLGLADEAVSHLEYLHQRYPENEEMTVELARGRFKQGKPEETRQLLDAVLAAHPDCVSALIERGRLALTAEDAAGAEKWLRQALAHSPHDPQAVHLLCAALLHQGDRDEVQVLQDRGKQTDRDFARLSDICLKELGERPNDPALHCELGTLLLRLGYREAGRAWLLRAVIDDPSYGPARAALTTMKRGADDAPSKP